MYTAIVIWDGQYCTIDNESETMPLVGMPLFRGYDLHIQTIEGGSITIDALPIGTDLSKLNVSYE